VTKRVRVALENTGDGSADLDQESVVVDTIRLEGTLDDPVFGRRASDPRYEEASMARREERVTAGSGISYEEFEAILEELYEESRQAILDEMLQNKQLLVHPISTLAGIEGVGAYQFSRAYPPDSHGDIEVVGRPPYVDEDIGITSPTSVDTVEVPLSDLVSEKSGESARPKELGTGGSVELDIERLDALAPARTDDSPRGHDVVATFAVIALAPTTDDPQGDPDQLLVWYRDKAAPRSGGELVCQ